MTETPAGAHLLDEHLNQAGPGRAAELAKLLEVSEQTIWTWRRGKRTPDEKFWEPLKALCGIPTESWPTEADRAHRERLRRICEHALGATGTDG